MWNKDKNKQKFGNMPFSKKTVTYARLEAYVFTILLGIMVWFDKDVSAIAVVLSLAWAGYRLLQTAYINMAKHEHLMDKKIEYKKLGLETDVIDEKLYEVESEEIIVDEYE